MRNEQMLEQHETQLVTNALAGAVCAHCGELPSAAVMLHCLHTMCLACVKSQVRESCVQCAMCRMHTVLDADGVDSLPRNTLVERLAELTSDRTAVCANCQDPSHPIRFYCRNCEARICEVCYKHTHSAHMMRSHHVITVEERRKELESNPQLGNEADQSAVNEYRTHLAVVSRSLVERKAALSDAVSNLTAHLENVNDAFDKVALQMMLHFQNLHQALEARENQLLQDARNVMNMKLERLQAQRDALSTLLREAESGVSTSSLVLRHGLDAEVLDLAPVIQERIENMAKSQVPFEPCEECDLTYHFDERLFQTIAMHGSTSLGEEIHPHNPSSRSTQPHTSLRSPAHNNTLSTISPPSLSSAAKIAQATAQLEQVRARSNYQCINWGNVNNYIHVQREGNQSLAAWLTRLRDSSSDSRPSSSSRRQPHSARSLTSPLRDHSITSLRTPTRTPQQQQQLLLQQGWNSSTSKTSPNVTSNNNNNNNNSSAANETPVVMSGGGNNAIVTGSGGRSVTSSHTAVSISKMQGKRPGQNSGPLRY